MKKLLFFILIIFLFSCKKDECWHCVTKVVTQCSGYASYDTTVTSDECDMSADEIKAYEKALTKTITATTGGITCTERWTCKCN